MQDNELRERRAFRETFTRQKCHMEVVNTLPTLSKLAQKQLEAEKMQEDNKLKTDLMSLFVECKSSGSVISPVASPLSSEVHSADKTKFSRRPQRVAVYNPDPSKFLQDCKDEFHRVSDPVVKNTRYEYAGSAYPIYPDPRKLSSKNASSRRVAIEDRALRSPRYDHDD